MEERRLPSGRLTRAERIAQRSKQTAPLVHDLGPSAAASSRSGGGVERRRRVPAAAAAAASSPSRESLLAQPSGSGARPDPQAGSFGRRWAAEQTRELRRGGGGGSSIGRPPSVEEFAAPVRCCWLLALNCCCYYCYWCYCCSPDTALHRSGRSLCAGCARRVPTPTATLAPLTRRGAALGSNSGASGSRQSSGGSGGGIAASAAPRPPSPVTATLRLRSSSSSSSGNRRRRRGGRRRRRDESPSREIRELSETSSGS